jgi:acyl-CoA thioesterase
MPSADTSPQATADLVREGLFANDRASKALGMQVLEVAPGRAVLAMAVRDDMLNGHDICHGGLMATLADSAFAFACNSYNELTVAAGFSTSPRRAGATCSPRAAPR